MFFYRIMTPRIDLNQIMRYQNIPTPKIHAYHKKSCSVDPAKPTSKTFSDLLWLKVFLSRRWPVKSKTSGNHLTGRSPLPH